MDTRLINEVWRCLPKEFKKEVKAHYAGLNAAYKAYLSKDSLSNEECDRCNVLREKMALYQMYFGIDNLTSDADEGEMLCVSRKKVQGLHDLVYEIYADGTKEWYQGYMKAMHDLFGSKCLPDELNEDNFATKKPQPAEPKDDKHFDNIVKDNFRNERRLHIAAMAMQGILSNADRMKGYEHVATTSPCEELTVVVACNALRYADALIKKVKGEEK